MTKSQTKILNFANITLEIPSNVPSYIHKDIRYYCESYDFYPEMIDSFEQQKKALARNALAISELKNLGVISAKIENFETYSGKKITKELF